MLYCGKDVRAARYIAERLTQAGIAMLRFDFTGLSKFPQAVLASHHHLLADEPTNIGGHDSGPGPYDFLLAGLGACTSMTIRLYAAHKKLPLTRVTVQLSQRKIHAVDCADCETSESKVDQIDRIVTLEGTLDHTQRAKLMEIADKCPVHRTLESEIKIRTREQRDE